MQCYSSNFSKSCVEPNLAAHATKLVQILCTFYNIRNLVQILCS